MNKSHLLINEQALQVLPSLAVALGLEEGIAIQQIHYWLNNSKNEGRVDEDGNKWVYNTYAQWKEDNFPFWSEDKIQRIFLSLEKQGVVISKQLDAKKRDMTKFYRIDYDALCAMDSLKSASSNGSKVNDVKMNQRLPKNTSLQTDEEKPEYKTKPDLMALLLSQPNVLQEREKLAINAFESAFGITRPWTWYPPRTSDERTWKDFRAYVLELFEADHDCFTKYVTWTRVPYAKGTMTALGIKRNPQDFPDSWTCYLASDGMYAKKNEPVERNPAGI